MSYKRNAGFTLVELMVVMAIIAILATAGISGYSGYIKGARDTVRIADLKGIETIVLSEMGVNGTAPTLSDLVVAIEQANGKLIQDPINKSTGCLTSTADTTASCKYEYDTCDGSTGYIIRTAFESPKNATGKYKNDDGAVGANGAGLSDAHFEIGNCAKVDTAASELK